MPPVKKAKVQKPKKKGNHGRSAKKELKSAEPIAVVSGQLQKKIQKQQEREDKKRGIVFIKHLPHGFFEEQLQGYFEQFGKVTRLRLARSSKTGGSKGYAFVEFEYPEVAQVAAETMNNYLMFQKLVKADYIPPEKQKFNYFKTTLRKVTNKAGKEIYVSTKTKHVIKRMKEHNNWSDNNYQRRAGRALKKLESLKKKFGHLGIDFSKILIAPQRIQDQSKEDDGSIDEDDGDTIKLESKTRKKKSGTVTVTASQTKTKNGKLNKELTTLDLLDTSYNSEDDADFDPHGENSDEDTSDEDNYISDEEKLNLKNLNMQRSKKNESLTTADLLGTTIDEDSADDDFVPSKKLNTVKKIVEKSSGANKKKQDLTQKKPSLQSGKIQKPSKKPLAGVVRKAKPTISVVSKNKKSLQMLAAKEMAKPLKTLRGKVSRVPLSKAGLLRKSAKK